ncbi:MULTISPECIES: hypothetical protein [Paenibacillus]|nr:hypothetical protein [Paenibacillus odorifer]
MTVSEKQKMKEALFREIIKDLMKSEVRMNVSKGGGQDAEASKDITC